MTFKEKCVHCEHAKEDVKCCFCGEYVHKSGNIIFHADVPINVIDVNVKAGEDYANE